MRYLLGDDDDDATGRLLCLAYMPVLTHGPCVALSQGPPKYIKAILKKGDKTNFPKKGDTVSCWYTGSLEDGTVFDTNVVTGTIFFTLHAPSESVDFTIFIILK